MPAGDVGSSESPEPGVTIVRDAGYGFPHVYGDTRPALMFGVGYATAEDRLFFIDALRHAGHGDQVQDDFAINDQPGHGTSGAHLGSAWDVGFYGIVQKDLRAVLGQPVASPLSRLYCGNGSRKRCRSALERSLRVAIAQPYSQVYPADGTCAAGDQMCSDSIQFRAIGAVTQPLIEWVNRPTFQQANEILGHGAR